MSSDFRDRDVRDERARDDAAAAGAQIDIDPIRARLRMAIERGAEVMAERRTLLELVFLALIAQENLLLIGPPGVGKSAAARLAAGSVGGRYFEYLIGRFTEPAEIFGPLDLAALQAGQVRPDVSGMLPEAEIAFLDEVFLGSTAILNTLLGVLNERRYRRGHVDMRTPLRACVAASNALPEEPLLRAFADRFLLTAFVDPVGDHALESLLASGWRFEDAPAPEPLLSMAEVDALAAAARAVEMDEARGLYAHVVRKLRGRGLEFSDRRIVKGQKLIAAAALAAGRSRASRADLWPLTFLAQDREAQAEARDVLQKELEESASPVFSGAAKSAGVGAAARAEEIRVYGVKLLESRPPLRAGPDWEAWLVRVESLLAQIDAGFPKERMPEALAALRAGLAAQASERPEDREPAGDLVGDLGGDQDGQDDGG